MPSAFGVTFDSPDFSILGNLRQTYEEGQAADRQDVLRQALQGMRSGGPVDWNKVVQIAMQTGNVSSLRDIAALLPIAKQADETAAMGQLGRILPGLAGSTEVPPVAPPVPPQPAPPPPRPGTPSAPPGWLGNYLAPGPQSSLMAPGTPPPTPTAARQPLDAIPPDVTAQAMPLPQPAASPETMPPFQVAQAGPGPIPFPTPPPMPGGGAIPFAPRPAPMAPPMAPAPQPQLPPEQLPPAPDQAAAQRAAAIRAQAEQMAAQANPYGQQAARLAALLPRLPPNTQASMQMIMQHLLRGNDLTPEQKNWIGYVRSGGNEDFATYQRLNRAADAGILTSEEGVKAEALKAVVAAHTQELQDLVKKSEAGRSMLPVLDTIAAISPSTPGGFAGQLAPIAQKIATTLGINWPGGVNAELMLSLQRRMVPTVREPGATSNLEMSQYLQAVPSLYNSPQGRSVMVMMLKAQIMRNEQVRLAYEQNIGRPADLQRALNRLDQTPLLDERQAAMFKQLTGVSLHPPVPGAMPGNNPITGKPGWYAPDPNRPGKFLEYH